MAAGVRPSLLPSVLAVDGPSSRISLATWPRVPRSVTA